MVLLLYAMASFSVFGRTVSKRKRKKKAQMQEAKEKVQKRPLIIEESAERQKLLQALYDNAAAYIDGEHAEEDVLKAAEGFRCVSGFLDADERAKGCLEMIDAAHMEELYNAAKLEMENAGENVENVLKAAAAFRRIAGYKDAEEKAAKCVKKAEKTQTTQSGSVSADADSGTKKYDESGCVIWFIIIIVIYALIVVEALR